MTPQPPPPSKPAPLIYLNAFPGVGKLTIARALQLLLLLPHQNSNILHNHALIDPVEALYPRHRPWVNEKRTAYRRERLAEVAEDKGTVWIVTDAQTEWNDCMADFWALTGGLEGEAGRRFYSVVLVCGVEENVRRFGSMERRVGGHGKLTDAELLREFREKGEVWRFGGEDEMVLDVTYLSAEEAAGRIAEFVRRREMVRR